jgi:hypothetical protein
MGRSLEHSGSAEFKQIISNVFEEACTIFNLKALLAFEEAKSAITIFSVFKITPLHLS